MVAQAVVGVVTGVGFLTDRSLVTACVASGAREGATAAPAEAMEVMEARAEATEALEAALVVTAARVAATVRAVA